MVPAFFFHFTFTYNLQLKMQYCSNEIKILIFKYVDSPLNLALTCKNWCVILKDEYAKTEWLVVHYGKAHAFFHAVRLGPTFIDIPVCQTLIAKKVPISRYFIQRLLMCFGKCDQKLMELRLGLGCQFDDDKIRAIIQNFKFPWASNLPIYVFTYLLEVGYKQFGEDLPSKGNDMELFDFLSVSPHTIRNVPDILEDLILNERFIPFPSRPKEFQDLASEKYPSDDGFENNRELNIITKGILTHPNLVNLWKYIGYYEICNDFNDLVMEGVLINLFPRTPEPNWTCPSINTVIKRLAEFISLGFKLNDNVIENALKIFENRLVDVGDILLKAFLKFRSGENGALQYFREELERRAKIITGSQFLFDCGRISWTKDVNNRWIPRRN